MEFGLFFNGYLPGPAAHDPDSEHLMLMREPSTPCSVIATTKYAWFGEHHGLTEYSHMSAPYPVMGYVAGRTKQIHVGSAITSFPTSKDHPVRIAERAAMMDHLSRAVRVRHRSGCRQPRGPDVQRHRTHRDQGHVGRGHPRDPAHVGAEGLRAPWRGVLGTNAYNILRSPTARAIPMWVACGNPPPTKAGAMGLGAIA